MDRRAAIAFHLIALSSIAGARAARAETLVRERSAEVVSAVRPVGGKGCESRGSGLALGDGLVLTAAHILLDPADLAHDCPARVRTSRPPFLLRTRIGSGSTHAGTLVAAGMRGTSKTGAMTFAGSRDFALVRIEGLDTRARLAPCAAPPIAGQTVVVVLRGGVVATRVAARRVISADDDAAYVDLEHVFDHGTSGAGVLDAGATCVLGLVSHRFPEPRPRVTRMTPVAVFASAWAAAIRR